MMIDESERLGPAQLIFGEGQGFISKINCYPSLLSYKIDRMKRKLYDAPELSIAAKKTISFMPLLDCAILLDNTCSATSAAKQIISS